MSVLMLYKVSCCQKEHKGKRESVHGLVALCPPVPCGIPTLPTCLLSLFKVIMKLPDFPDDFVRRFVE